MSGPCRLNIQCLNDMYRMQNIVGLRVNSLSMRAQTDPTITFGVLCPQTWRSLYKANRVTRQDLTAIVDQYMANIF